MIHTILVLIGGFAGGATASFFLRRRGLDTEVRIAATLATAQQPLGGFDIGKRAGVGSGAVYPILYKFEELGMVRSHWEDRPPTEINPEPRRRLYEWTAGPVGAR